MTPAFTNSKTVRTIVNADGYKTDNHEAFTYRRSPDGNTLLRHTHTGGIYLVTFMADGRSIATGNRPMSGGFQPGDVHTTVQSSLPVILSRHRKEVAFAIERGGLPVSHIPARWAWGWEAAAGVPSNIDVARENHQRYKNPVPLLQHLLFWTVVLFGSVGVVPLIFFLVWAYKTNRLHQRHALTHQSKHWRTLPSMEEILEESKTQGFTLPKPSPAPTKSSGNKTKKAKKRKAKKAKAAVSSRRRR